MASPTPKPPKRTAPQTARHAGVPSNPPEVVDPVWILKALGITLVAALICGYATLCLLFYQGQWQLVLHPSRSKPAPSSIDGARFETVRFGVDETALPQLTGWWIPAEPTARYVANTILYLPSGDGSMADAVKTLAALHTLGINIFAFDYRGYGQSAATHPNERRMSEDATSALQYLTTSRALAPAKLVLFGDGVGGALAVKLAAAHPDIPAVILQAPRPDLIGTVFADPRTRSLPVRMLFHDRFEVTESVSALKTPKLFLLSDQASKSVKQEAAEAASPKMVSTFPSADLAGPVYRAQVTRFLDQYLR